MNVKYSPDSLIQCRVEATGFDEKYTRWKSCTCNTELYVSNSKKKKHKENKTQYKMAEFKGIFGIIYSSLPLVGKYLTLID